MSCAARQPCTLERTLDGTEFQDGFTPLAVALQQGHDRVVAVLLENDSRGKVHLPALHIAAKKDDVKATTLLLQNEHNVDTNKNGGLVNDTTKSGFTPLHIASHYGNVNVGRLLIDRSADVNYKARNSITPLHVASKWGRCNMVELLLDAKASINSKTRDGLTPLHCAARSGHDSVVDLLLERGALVTCKTKNGLTPLHMSSQGDHLDCARLLLYHKAPIDEVTVDYLTPLHVVAHCGNVKTAKLLLDRKCEVNARALNGFTPLHIACKKNRIKIVELLLKYGASLEATTESGLTPLHVASFMGHMNIAIFLIQHGSNPNHTTMRGETALHLAARANQTDIVRILLRNGAQVDHAKATEQQTALHISSRLGNVDNILLLLQHGASPDAVTRDLYTPLHIAAKEGHDEIVQVLLEHGAKQTPTTKKGFIPLHVAAKYGNLRVVQMLIQHGTDPNLEGKNSLTPLHVATHYSRVAVALYLLEKGASPHCATKNGYTPLHIAAKKNQMDIATTLLEHGSNVDAESRNGFTPLHLTALEGHTDMVSLLAEHGADVNSAAKNGLTPLHLTAQEDRVDVAEVLVSFKARIDPQTKAGYTPLHTASHFGQIAMIRFLLERGAAVNSGTKLGYTSLHQAAQQGRVLVTKLLLNYGASPNSLTSTGQTPLSIAQRLGYISVVEILKHLTEVSVSPSTMEEKYKVMFPETMQETPISDSEEEEGGGGEESVLIDQSFHYLVSSEKPSDNVGVAKEAKRGFVLERARENESMDSSLGQGTFINERKHSKESGILSSDFKGFKDDAMITSFSECSQSSVKMETVQSEVAPCQYSSQEIPSSKVNHYDDGDYYQYTSSFSGVSNAQSYETSVDFPSDNSAPYSSGFLVSFVVDARGGAMRGCRHSGVRVIIPPGKACMPTRVMCRLVKKEKVMNPPALMEGEALASRILEMGPVGTRFNGPVIIEVPHFASLRGKEREITVLRSENGQTWREHTVASTEEAVHEALQGGFFPDLESADDLLQKRITRILTTEVPQYFAIVARVRQEMSTIGPDGGMISSTVVPRVQAIFPEGSLTKNIKVGLQVLPVSSETVSKLFGNRVAVSPIVTIEPRRRKFHRPITLTIPVPMTAQKGMLNQYGNDRPTMRLLCSIMGGTSPAEWEDITGTTPLTFINDCVSFTTTVSARFWLMDCQNVNESAKMASDLYHDVILAPFMSRFVVYAKRHDPIEAQLHVFCMTDDKMDKLLENRGHFKQVARSNDVEILEAKPQYVEMSGNLVPVTKSGEKLCVDFRAFRENRLAFTVRMRDVNLEAGGLLAFVSEPKSARPETVQAPVSRLMIALPDYEPSESPAELEELEMQFQSIKKRPAEDQISKAELWLTDIADSLGSDWIRLAHRMKIEDSDVSKIEEEYADDSEKALVVLHLWIQKYGERATGNELEKALRSIGHEDIVQKCMYNIEEVTDAVEKVVAKVYLDSSGFDALRDELGSSRESSIPCGVISLDVSYEEQDLIKDSESFADDSITLDGNNIELASLDGREIAPVTDSFDEQHFQEVKINMENSSCNTSNHLSYFEKQRLSGDNISEAMSEPFVNTDVGILTNKVVKETTATDILESSFTEINKGILQWKLKEFDDDDDEQKRILRSSSSVVLAERSNSMKFLGDLDEFFRIRSFFDFRDLYFSTYNKIINQNFESFDRIALKFSAEQRLFSEDRFETLVVLPQITTKGRKRFKVLDDAFPFGSCWLPDRAPCDTSMDLSERIHGTLSHNLIWKNCSPCAGDLNTKGTHLYSPRVLIHEEVSNKDVFWERKALVPTNGNQFAKKVPDNVNPEKEDPGGINVCKSTEGNTSSDNGQKSGKDGKESDNAGGSQNLNNNGDEGDGDEGNGGGRGSNGRTSVGGGEVQCRTEECEDQSVLSDGTVVIKKIVKKTFWRQNTVASADNSDVSLPAIMEEVIRIEINEDIKEIPRNVCNLLDVNVTSETTTELSEYQMSNGACVKKTVTKTRFWLKEQSEEESQIACGGLVDDIVSNSCDILHDSKNITDANLISSCIVVGNSSEMLNALQQNEIVHGLLNTNDCSGVSSDSSPTNKGRQTSEVIEEESTQPDGTTITLQTLTKYFCEDLPALEKIENIEIEEKITEMALGVSERFGDDVEIENSSDCSAYLSPDGKPTKETTVEVSARLENSSALVVPAPELSLSLDSEVVDPYEKNIAEENHGIESRIEVSEDKVTLSDGTTRKRKLVVKTFYRQKNDPATENEKDSEKVVRIEIEEHVTELPAGISESFNEDADAETTTESSEYQLPDGTPVQRTLTNVVIHKQLDSVKKAGDASEKMEEVQVKTKVTQNEDVLKDGTTVRTITTTKLFVKEILLPDGNPIEKVLRKEIEEFVTELAAGVLEPYGDAVDTEMTKESFEFQLSDGSPATKTLIRVTAQPKSLAFGNGVSENKTVCLAKVPGILAAAGREISRQHLTVSEGKSGGGGGGDIEVRTGVTEDENVLVDGTVVKKQTTTRTAVRSAIKKGISEEEIVETEIEERIVQLAPGITDPFGDDVETESSTESFRYYHDNGSPVVKTVVMIIAHFPLSVSSLAATNDAQILSTDGVNHFERLRLSAADSNLEPDTDLINGSVVDDICPLTHPDVAKLIMNNMSAKKGALCKKIRNVAPDGSITEEDICTYEDEDSISDTSSVSDIRDLSPFAFSSATDDLALDDYDPDSLAIQVCTSTVDAVPTIENDVKEYEDVLPDGTIVRRKVMKTTEQKTFVNHVVIHVPHTSRPVDGNSAVENNVEPYLAKYSHVCRGAPQITTDTQEFDDVMPNGTATKRRIKRTAEEKLSMERTLLVGNMPSLCGLEEGPETTAKRTSIPTQYSESQDGAIQETSRALSTQELSRAHDDEKVSRVLLKKQTHKKTIVQSGKEETIVTEDTRIEQDDNAPQELQESVRELIQQFLDSNGDHGSTDELPK